jgi:RHS repeat-associated protein
LIKILYRHAGPYTKRTATNFERRNQQMTTQARVRNLVMVLSLCLSVPVFSAKPQASNPIVPLTGQTATALPDGNWLVVGGQDANGHALGTLSLRDSQGNERRLLFSLRFPRSWHTATVLPDGTVLILGGIGADGQIVEQPEILDSLTQSSQLLSSGVPAPRAFHSATLLTDGRVLIAGGASLDGKPLLGAELWDPRQKTSSAPPGQLGSARRNHSATLLADGRVLLIGGKDGAGNALSSGELYDPQSQMFSPIASPELLLSTGTGITEAIATSPEDGAVDVARSALISMRFSRSLRLQTINNQTVLLEGPAGTVKGKIIGAEGGMLAFITPQVELLPATNYSVTFSGAIDANNATAAFMQFSFTTEGTPPSDDVWTPDLGWMSNRATSKWQSMPPLQAAPGITAVAGKVLKLDGTPLHHVTLLMGGRRVISDGTGRFLLANIPSGHASMTILGSTANTSTRTYGTYEVGVDVRARITNVLPYIIWMTPLDTAHAVKISSPTTTETVITNPRLPGLELHIPANTVITDYYGKPVTEISITPIPLDRPPFPLPAVQVPIYFTIQPGSAYIKIMNNNGVRGARLFYPNAYSFAPGTLYNFWNYAPDNRGWYIYGQGRVSPDGRQIIPNPGVEIYSFTGAMVASPGNAPATGPSPGNDSDGGDPVDLGTGLFVYRQTDLNLPDVIPLSLVRTYRQADSNSYAFGIGTSLPYDMFIVGDNVFSPEGYTYQDLILADGSRVHFQRISPCTGPNGYCDFSDAVYEHTSSPTKWFGATIKIQACFPGGIWTLTTKDGTSFCFPESSGATSSRAAAVTGIRDRYGNALALTRDQNFNLTKIASPNGRWIQFTYDANKRVTQAQDNIGRVVTYSYDAGGRLTQVTDTNGGVWNYTYDTFNQMLSIQNPLGIVFLTNQYDASGRVVKQTQTDNSIFLFSYTTDPTTGRITQTDLTDPNGNLRRTTYGANGYKAGETFALGNLEQQTITYNRDPNTTLINSVIDSLSRQTSYSYDSLGNILSITRLAGTANAATISLTYQSTFSQLASFTDPLGNITTLSRDNVGNLIAITDPLGHQATFTYNQQGLPVSEVDALGNTRQFAYSGGDEVGITDPLGNTITRFVDNAGRILSVTDTLGHTTHFSYNALDQILQITDPFQNTTVLGYDAMGNLLGLTDALNHAATWSYDSRNRVAVQTDPLGRQATFSYDANSNIISATDRKGQVATFSYDRLNRRTFAGFLTLVSGGVTTYESTINYTWDAGNRMTQAADSIGGAITRTYDGLDRLSSETTPLGSVGYAYDNSNRKTSAQVTGQQAVSYTWDNASRLTQVSQGTSAVSLGYDDANRRSSMTLPNSVAVSYGYDSDSRLTSMTYQSGTNTLGNLGYGYDQAGRRTQVSGSFARIGLPQPITSASYDVANELINWNGLTIPYDANGNMLSDGVNVFTFDARNQAASINGINLQYDAFGRRTQNLLGAGFLYDGANAIETLSGATVTSHMLTGEIDEVFSRTDSSGSLVQLTDALGSTIALVDSTGNIQTSYTYDPFGGTSITGLIGTNVFEYTGRENEGNGLYYYRARYYSPQFGRFISEDPIGYWGGINAYAYVGNNPVNFVDPFGLDPDLKEAERKFHQSAAKYATSWLGAAGGPKPSGWPNPAGPPGFPHEWPKGWGEGAGAGAEAYHLANTIKDLGETVGAANDMMGDLGGVIRAAGNAAGRVH